MKGYIIEPISQINIAIFASGNGSNAINLIETYQKNNKLQANLAIKTVICDQEKAPILDKMSKYDISCNCIPKKAKQTKADHEATILRILKEEQVNWVLLAGYMRILSSAFLNTFTDARGFNRVVNIHPSLLPAFKGIDGYKQAFNYGVKESGVTLHFVDDKIDNGPIILQDTFKRETDDTLSSFKEKGIIKEHKLYSDFLSILAMDRFRLTNNLIHFPTADIND